MTCVAAVANQCGVYMGADSAGISGTSLTIRADEKVFVNGEFIFGFTSSFRMGQVLRFGFTPPRQETLDIYKYMVTDFVDAVRNRFRETGYLSTENGRENGGTFMVGCRNRIFTIHDDFQVAESKEMYEAIGCGRELALGALYSLRKLTSLCRPMEHVELALAAAERHCSGVRGPFQILAVEEKA